MYCFFMRWIPVLDGRSHFFHTLELKLVLPLRYSSIKVRKIWKDDQGDSLGDAKPIQIRDDTNGMRMRIKEPVGSFRHTVRPHSVINILNKA